MEETQQEAVEATATAVEETGEERRVYEVGYHILSTVNEDALEPIVAEIRTCIDASDGSLIAEGAPQSIKLSYPIRVDRGGRYDVHDRAFFGWIKFDAPAEAAITVKEMLDGHKDILRHIIFKTVREDTRASMRPFTLREVKRTDTITSTPRKGAESKEKGTVSEEALDKSIEDLIAE